MFKSYKYYSLLAICAGTLSFTSCKKALELLPEDKLDKSLVYNTVADADAVVLGIYGQVASLGGTYIILNELRADLVDVTRNADPHLQQISAHNVASDNPYIDPTPFYKVIFNCNDALKNFKIMASQAKLSQDDFNQRYSDILVLRTWLYLQLGIHYGNIPYLSDAIETVHDIPALNNTPKLTFDQLIDRLLEDVVGLPYDQHYAYPTGSSLVFNTDGFSTQKVFISKPSVLGELYLWKGNYYQAAYWLKKTLAVGDGNANIGVRFNNNRVGWYDSSDANIQVSFARSQEGGSLVNSLTAGWRSIFALPNTNRHWFTEWNWAIPYHNSFAPGNPFVDLVSREGGYKIMPSQKVIDLWNAQTMINGIPWDARGKLSYTVRTNGDAEITKLTDNSAGTLTPLNRGGQWNIMRAAGAHLRFAEAANRDGHGRVAYALINEGIMKTFYYGAYTSAGAILPSNFFELESEITHQGFGEDRVHYPTESPYYFDARDNSSIVRGDWYRNIGIRGRAMMPKLVLEGIEYSPGTSLDRGLMMTKFDVNINLLEDKIIEEAALELAFEGSRWSDLTRIARRRGDASFLADKIYEKLLKANHPQAGQIRSKLMDQKNWYLPFSL